MEAAVYYLGWALGVYAALGTAFALVLSIRASRAIVRPHFSHPQAGAPLSRHQMAVPAYWGNANDPLAFDIPFEDVEFAAWDGRMLRGWYVPTPTASTVCIVCAHGGGRDRRAFLRHVPFLHKAGFNVLLADMRGHGASDGTGTGLSLSHGMREHEDVLAGCRFVHTTYGITAVILLGTSVGAASCIVAAARSKLDAMVGEMPAIVGVVAENPFSSVSANVKGLVELLLFWHGLCLQSRLLYCFFWPIMRLTQSLSARAVRNSLQAAWEANLQAVKGHREATGAIHGISSSAGVLTPQPTSTGTGSTEEAVAVLRPSWWEWQEPEVAISHLGPDVPIFLLHGTSDRMIQVNHSQRLYAAAREPKQLWIVEGGSHCALHNAYPAEYEERVMNFIEMCTHRAARKFSIGTNHTPQVDSTIDAASTPATNSSGSGSTTVKRRA